MNWIDNSENHATRRCRWSIRDCPSLFSSFYKNWRNRNEKNQVLLGSFTISILYFVLIYCAFQCCFVIFDTKRHEMIRWPKVVFDHILKQLLIKLFISIFCCISSSRYCLFWAYFTEPAWKPHWIEIDCKLTQSI